MKNYLCLAFTSLLLLWLPQINFGQAPPTLGSTSQFALFTGTGAFEVTGASTTVTGDVGTHTGAFNAFPLGTLNGTRHVANATSATAAAAVLTAYNSFPVTCVTIPTLSNVILTPGVYCLNAATAFNGVLTLNGQGDPNALFIFRIDGALSTGGGSTVNLINSATCDNVYWRINGAVNMGGNSTFKGTIVAVGALNLAQGVTLVGRGLSTAGAISLADNISVSIGTPPSASTISGATTVCAGQTITLSGNVNGTWSNGSSAESITIGTAGDYFVTNTNACGSVTSNHIVVTVSQIQSCTITGDGSICQGATTQLCVPTGSSGYSWSTGATTNCITVDATGAYSVTVTNNGCSSICSKTVTVNPLPACTISGASSICQGSTTQLCAPAGSSGYSWSTGATTNCITVGVAGTYSVTVTNSGCTSICNKTITVNPVPVCTISGASSICQGATTQLCAPAGSSGYSWSTGATTNCITVSASGTYSVTVTNNGCSSICSKTVTVHPLPACTISGAGSICQGLTTQLCAPAGSSGYSWSTGATTNCITVSAAGTYSVTVTNGGGCNSTCSKTVALDSPPTAAVISAGGPTTFCIGGSVILSGNTNGTWNNGGGTAPSIVVTSSGDYFVTTANACSSVASNHIIIKVNPLPIPSIISANDAVTFCIGDSVVLSGNTGGKWNTGATTSSITVKTSGDYFVTNSDTCGNVSSNHIIVKVDLPPAISIITASDTTAFCVPGSVTLSGNVAGIWNTGSTASSIVVTTSGDYFVTTANSCSTRVSNHIVVTVHPLPVASVITSNHIRDTICLGDSIILSGNIGGIWNNGATSSSITVKRTGTFFVTNSNFCDTVSSNSIQIRVDSVPSRSIITAAGPTAICVGDSVILTGNTGGVWNTGDTSSFIIVKTSGDYFVRQLYSCDSGISNHIQVLVKIKTNPIDIIINRDTICIGDSIIISGNAGGYWNTGDTTFTIVVKTTGIYFVVNENYCDSIGPNTVTELTVVARPVTLPILSDTICLGDEITLGLASIAGHSYKWTTANGTLVSTLANPKVKPSKTTTYILTETIIAGACEASNSVKITVGPLPSCVIKGNNLICEGQSTQLCAPAGDNTYLWSTGETTRCITVDSIGNYAVEVTNSFGCSSRCSRNVLHGEGPCDIVGTELIYAGQSTEFCAPKGYASYRWSTGETTRCIIVKTTGTYGLTVTNAMGCVSLCSKVLTVAPAPYCEIIGDTIICPDSYATLCAVAVPGNTYYWNNGQTTQCIEINCQGKYSVQITNRNATNICVINVSTAAALPKPLSSCIISGNLNPAQGQVTTLCAPPGYLKYLWSNGAVTSCITVNTGGTYALKVSNGGGFSHTCQVKVAYPSTSVNSLESRNTDLPVVKNFSINAYPNPFSTRAHFEFSTDQTGSQVKVEVTGLAGNKILTLFEGKAEKGQVYRVSMDGSSMAEGIYLYRIINGNQSITKKIVLIK